MAKISFSEEEKALMKSAVRSGHSSWSDNTLEQIKRRIKDYHLLRQRNCCCYCSRNLYGEFRMVIDIEHIYPKSKLVNHMFTQKNLSASCKRCNMYIKKDSVKFINCNDFTNVKKKYLSRNYKIVHPNLDIYKKHIKYIYKQEDRNVIIKYSILNNSSKGQYTYDFFRLNELELNSFDEAQGASSREEINNEHIFSEFKNLKNIYGS